jgi:hypothetical protein
MKEGVRMRSAGILQARPARFTRLRRRSFVALIICGMLFIAPTWALFNASAASGFANPAFQAQWAAGEAITPNFWGPLSLAHDGQNEPYVEAPGGQRLVQYFDKARMELTNPATGIVTNGLLAVELISGREQLGDNTFQAFSPAAIPVAGDPNNAGPTYAQIGASGLMTATPSAVGQPTTRALTNTGAAGTYAAGGGDANATIAAFDATTQHNVPRAFNDYRNKAGLLTIGLAIAEPFWANGVLVGGQPKDVLVQAFERRVLTYTPSNPDPFKVEFGNIGQHYYTWRYVTNGGGGTGTPTTTPTATTTTAAAPVLTHPTVTNVTSTKATVSFTTDVAACGTAEIRVKGDTSFMTNIDTISCTPSTTVTVTLTSLNPNTQYEVRGAAKVGSGPVGYSDIAAFTTLTATPTADSYEGYWVNDVTPSVGQFSQFRISTTGNNVTVHIFDKGTPTDTDVGTQTATFTADPLTFALNGHNYTVSFTDDTRTHLKVVVALAANGTPEGTYTFHRLILIAPPNLPPVLIKP